MYLVSLFAFTFGLFWGSFLGVIKDRADNLRSVLKGRSYCPKCKRTLGAFELIPIISFLLLRGRCRSCRTQISLEYPLIELLSGLLTLGVFLKYGFSLITIILFFSLSLLLVASFLDAKNLEVELWVLLVGSALALFWKVGAGGLKIASLENIGLGILIFASIPFLMALVSRERWMGWGDGLFALWGGILVGYPQALAGIFLAFLTGAFFAILLLVGRKKGWRAKVPFGPFLAVGAVGGLFFADTIINWYLKLLGL